MADNSSLVLLSGLLCNETVWQDTFINADHGVQVIYIFKDV